jgi:hypothetical protein
VCREKIGKQCHECPYCQSLWPILEMDAHIMSCPSARAAGAKPTGASAALAKRLTNHQKHLAAGTLDLIMGEETLGGGGMDGVSELGSGSDDTRVSCHICQRKFAIDRIGKHQAICQKIANKLRPKTKRYHQEGPSRSAPPASTHWRQQSDFLRQAAKAGRGEPEKVTPRRSVAEGSSRSTQFSKNASADNHAAGRSHATMVLMKEQFNNLDLNGDGVLSQEELASFLKAVNPHASDKELAATFSSVDTNHDGTIDLHEFESFVLGGMEAPSGKRPAVGSAVAFARREGSHRHGKVPESPQMPKMDSFQRTNLRLKTSSLVPGRSPNQTPDATLHRSKRCGSAGALARQALSPARVPDLPDLPEWGSASSSRYGRECMTSPPVRMTPHNTSWGGCSAVPVQGTAGFESIRCSANNPLDRSWRYELHKPRSDLKIGSMTSQKQSPAVPANPAAPVLLGRTSWTRPDKRHVHFE